MQSPRQYIGDEVRWEAVLERAPGADGLFVYGVSSTRIYCRPACPSRRPLRKNATFFDTADLAEAAGFRPCRRCQPNEVSTQQRVIAQAQQLLETMEPPPTLTALGEAVGMSPFHLQRLFKRATGLSPREYGALMRAERLKAELRGGATVTDALYDAGYGSVRALYDKADKHLGMSPGAYKRGGKGVTITYSLSDTPIGRMLLATTPKGVCSLQFGDDDALAAALGREFPQAVLLRDDQALQSTAGVVLSYLQGEHRGLDLPLDVAATDFQRQVWEALRTIPYGQTRSYQAVAHMIGAPRAVRAVARACATNPVALVVPCHRVVRTGGELSGYRWGIDRKRRLLEQERE